MPVSNDLGAMRVADNVRVARIIMPEVLARESELSTTKWFAYRFMSPLAATKLFAEIYTKGVKAYVRRHRDIDEAEKANGISQRIFSEPSGSLTQLWQARQKADEWGLPYDLLVEFAFAFASRRKWKRTPRPIQLLPSKTTEIAWMFEIEKFLDEHLPLTFDRFEGMPQYQTENYRSLPAQDEFRAYVQKHLSTRGDNWSVAFARACVRDRYLPVRIGMNVVPRGQRLAVISTVRDDLSSGLLSGAPSITLPDMAFVPSCFGLPSALDKSGQCKTCVFSQACQSMAASVGERLRDLTGSTSPVATSRRQRSQQKARERQQRFRDRKKASRAAEVAIS